MSAYRFSTRAGGHSAPNRLTRAIEAARRAGPLLDLTGTNPTTAGIAYPRDLLAPLGAADSLTYEPRPLGLACAREAVSDDYARRGVRVPPSRVVLTASSSESYALLFKLLCDAGASVLVPAPSYPLFEDLTRLDAVRAVPYRTEYHGRWTLDPSAVAAAVDPSTRAILVVSPNNPTGGWIETEELSALADLCRERGLALIADEVFADYPLDPSPRAAASAAAQDAALTFALGGLSKSAGLPQVKLGWMAVSGSPSDVEAALERLESIADTYLSVSTPVQLAARRLMQAGEGIRREIHARVATNLAALREAAAAEPACDVLRVEGGWSAVVRVPAIRTDEDWALRLVGHAGVIVHPGYYFDFAAEGHLVLSLLGPPAEFRVAAARMFETIGADLAARPHAPPADSR